jgi:DNA (cytosine-5)-methyltransferase 1
VSALTSVLPSYCRSRTGLTWHDQFCGAGGASIGAEENGIELVSAANHWRSACDIYARNHQDARVDCADISQVDPRRYPTTDILMSGAECTNHSGAKGVSRKRQNPSLFEGPDPGAERSRATMWDVIRHVEYHRNTAVIVENVIDVVSWVLWPAWRQALTDLGYDVHVVSLNSAHTGRVAQWRDRVYVVAVRRGIAIDLEMRPACWCPTCEKVVEGRQVFKRWGTVAGLWRRQYNYRCPDCQGIAEPPAPPAAEIIDWSLTGERIGDRRRPLAASTRRRIEIGIDLYGTTLYASSGQTYERPGSGYARAWPLTQPAPTQTCDSQHSIAWPPGSSFLVQPAHTGDDQCRVRDLARPHPTVCAGDDRLMLVAPGGSHRGLVMAPQSGGALRPTEDPLPTLATKAAPLLVTYTRTGRAAPVSEPTTTVTCLDRHAVVEQGIDVDDCMYRMLQPHESGRAMAFPDTYIVEGTKKVRQRMYGNACTPPSISVLAGRVVEAIGAA